MSCIYLRTADGGLVIVDDSNLCPLFYVLSVEFVFNPLGLLTLPALRQEAAFATFCKWAVLDYIVVVCSCGFYFCSFDPSCMLSVTVVSLLNYSFGQ